MPFQPKPLSSLPRVVAGPILRKITPTSVSVFIVTTTGDPMVLKVYTKGDSNPVLESYTTTPYQIGANIYVALLTAVGATALAATQTHGYNIFWGSDHFGTEGILNDEGDTLAIAFDHINTKFSINNELINLPTFALPATDINKLWILHGSCRKPHGQGYDAMPGMAKIIEQAIINQPSPMVNPTVRPQILCLTGDQIYADDVADGLLHMLSETAKVHLGDNETLSVLNIPDIEDDLHKEMLSLYGEAGVFVPEGPYHLDTYFHPGKRAAVIHAMDFSVAKEDCRSHLITFNEFIMMYLFVWSDVLWPDSHPSWSEISYIKMADSSITAIPATTNFFGMGASMPSKSVNGYIEQMNRVTKFRKGLPDVRRLLANIQTLMVLDDHEVTDDLFYNKGWFDDIKVFALGASILRNGQAAFAIFQAWGNSPEQFMQTGAPEETAGTALMIAVNNLANAAVANDLAARNAAWTDIHYRVNYGKGVETLPNMGQYNRAAFYPLVREEDHAIQVYNVRFDFYYSYDALPFEIISLDTRRARAFRNGDNRVPSLMSYHDIDQQIKNRGSSRKPLTILLSASPVLGSKKFENTIDQGATATGVGKLNSDKERWNGDITFLYMLFSKLMSRSDGSAGEGWHRVVVLCGDVHCAFSKSLEIAVNTSLYFEPALPTSSRLVLASLCASAFKNQVYNLSGTWFMHMAKPGADESYRAFGYNNYAHASRRFVYLNQGTTRNDGENEFSYASRSTPSIHLPSSTYQNFPIEVDPPADFFTEVKMYESGALQYNPTMTGPATPKNILLEHKRYALNKGMRGGKYHVGKNNFGEVLFFWGASSKVVQHNLYWRNEAWSDTEDPLTPTSEIQCRASHQVPLNFSI